MSKKKTLVLLFIMAGGGFLILDHFYGTKPQPEHQQASERLPPPIVIKTNEVKYEADRIKILSLLKNEGTKPYRKIVLSYHIYEDSKDRKPLMDREMVAQWEQPELKNVVSIRKKRDMLGILQPDTAVTIVHTLLIPDQIAPGVKILPSIAVVSADLYEEQKGFFK